MTTLAAGAKPTRLQDVSNPKTGSSAAVSAVSPAGLSTLCVQGNP